MTLMLGALSAVADTLTLSNGDRMSGELVRLEQGALVFKTALAGQIIIPVEEVQSIDTKELREVSLDTGEKYIARFVARRNATDLVSVDGVIEEEFRLASVVDSSAPIIDSSLETSGPAQVGSVPSQQPSLTLEIGSYWRSGEEDYAGPTAALTIQNEQENFGLRSRTRVDLDEDEDAPAFLSSTTEWRLGHEEQVYPRITLDVERNVDRGLEGGGGVSVGAGKVLAEGSSHSLEAAAGVDVSYRSYDADLAPESGDRAVQRHLTMLRGDDDTQSKMDLNLRLQLRYTQLLFESSSFFANGTLEEDLVLTPSLGTLGDFRARSESSLLVGLGSEALRLRLNLLLDYDNNTPFDALEKWNTGVGAGLEWDF